MRPISELGHPIWTGTAGALIWFGAWRGKKVFTAVGVVGWVIAMAQHSLHDGMATLSHGPVTNVSDYPSLTSGLWTDAAGLLVLSLVWAVIGYYILRHAARELVPPQAVAGNAKHWRPQIKAWGLPKEHQPS